MKKFGSLFAVSLLSGAVTLGAYKFFLEPNNSGKLTIASPNYSKNVSLGAENIDFTTAAENTVHAVVHVKNVSVSKVPSNPLMEFIYGYQGPREQTQIGTGSGVIVTEDGYIVTNNHVIQDATEIEVTLNNNKSYKAKLVGTDSKMDIALLKVDADEKLPYVVFGDSDAIKVGEWVLAVGNPYNLNSTVTAGIVSAKARNLSNNGIQSFIQTDAAVNPGNSGGALVNTRGELVGINTMISSPTGSYAGYSFAVPSNLTRKIIEDLMQFGNVQRGVLGVEGSAETGEHYIADNRRSYMAMFKKSLGGGAVIGGTVYLKFLITSLGMVRFFENLFLALNYATSFLIIQFASFTLATKQPAMTAPALAQLLDDVDQDEGLRRFVDRTIALVRSQAASILGNVLMVVPVAIVIQVAIILLIQKPSMSDTKAISVLNSVSPFSAIWLYAAFTGLLLWLSSLIAGLMDNWFVLHRIHDVIRYNRRLGIVFGSLRAQRWALWWKENIAVVAANVSLAFLLIYGPTFLGFLGIGMEIRHVTLSAGAFAAAAVALGLKAFTMGAFWLGILGILLIGFMNVIVSFWFAFQMALRSRDLPALDRKRLYTAIWKGLKLSQDPCLCLLSN